MRAHVFAFVILSKKHCKLFFVSFSICHTSSPSHHFPVSWFEVSLKWWFHMTHDLARVNDILHNEWNKIQYHSFSPITCFYTAVILQRPNGSTYFLLPTLSMVVPQFHLYRLNYQRWMRTGMKLLYVFSQGLAASPNFPSYISHSRHSGCKSHFWPIRGFVRECLGQELGHRAKSSASYKGNPLRGSAAPVNFLERHLFL